MLKLHGVPLEEDEEEFLDEVSEQIVGKYAKPVGNLDKFNEDIRLLVRRAATEWTGKKPIVSVLTVEA